MNLLVKNILDLGTERKTLITKFLILGLTLKLLNSLMIGLTGYFQPIIEWISSQVKWGVNNMLIKGLKGQL